jgi:hypothetical protein
MRGPEGARGQVKQQPNVLFFIHETTLVNPAFMHSIVASAIVAPKALAFLHRFDSCIARLLVNGFQK